MIKQSLLAAAIALPSMVATAGQAPAPGQSGDCGSACAAFSPTAGVTANIGAGPLNVSISGGSIVISGAAATNARVAALNGKSVIVNGKVYTIVVT